VCSHGFRGVKSWLFTICERGHKAIVPCTSVYSRAG
jgi:hypothetical protein